MQVKITPFGQYNDHQIDLFELTNDNDMTVKVMNYGATITSITVPKKEGRKTELVCGFDTFENYFGEEYKNNAPYFGCTVGRYCSQIKDSKFKLNGTEYKLAVNCGANNLHGGVTGFDKKVWQAKSIEQNDLVGVEMRLFSKDMEEGFPGDVEVSVIFVLTNKNEIKISYKGVPTKATPLSMTNHTYFNLSGFNEDILGHKVSVFADKRQETDDTGAATGNIINVEGADDLRNSILIGDAQQAQGGGFEHFYITETNFEIKKVAEVEFPADGTKLEISTTEPCMLFYSGIYTSNDLKRESGEQYGQYRAFCCETHRYQNGPNIEGSPKSITKAGETFISTTIFKLSW